MTLLTISEQQYYAIFVEQRTALYMWDAENGFGYISRWYEHAQTVRLRFECEIHAMSFKLRWL